MINAKSREKNKHFWSKYNTTIVLFLLLTIFFFYAIFIALTLKPGIIPDEERHFAVSKQFSTALGIPADVPETLELNAMIKQNPNLYYWINGRFLNIVSFIFPLSNDWHLLIGLRIVNVFYALGTIIFCYLFSKEMISHKWWQLLPVFLLTNTIMFVFLAGGVNDDNLTHLACVASLYFLVRVLNHRVFLINSIAMLISLASCTLIKHRVFPFVFAVGVVWIIYFIKNKTNIFPLKFKGGKVVASSIILLFLIIGNLGLYGYNLLVYQSYLPSCSDILTKAQCDLRLVYLKERPPEFLLAHENREERQLTISESIDLGYPGPLKYLFADLIPFLFGRTFGVLGHRSHISVLATIIHILISCWMILVTLVYWRDYSLNIISLLCILIFYSAIMFSYIYSYELLLRFNHSYIQGRYMFSVIDIAYVFAAKILKVLPRKTIRIPSLILILLVYFITGPLTFILKFSSVFSDWLVF